MSPRIPIHSLCAALLLLTGCQATLKANDWSAYDGPGRAYFEKEEIELPYIGDPLEPMNRGIAGFNHGLMVWLASPITGVYRLIFPEQIRTGIGNIFENLLYPLRLVTNLLQGKGGGAWRETKRFGVNTTIGIAGILDSATAMGIESSREDFGQTFGKWGWRPFDDSRRVRRDRERSRGSTHLFSTLLAGSQSQQAQRRRDHLQAVRQKQLRPLSTRSQALRDESRPEYRRL
jgi:hypothetical protein